MSDTPSGNGPPVEPITHSLTLPASPPDDGSGRARARPPKEQRVRLLMAMLATGQYHSRATCIELGDEWDLSWETVRNDACEAARRLKCDPEEVELLRQKMAYDFERLAVKAEQMTSRQTGLPDFHAALKARELEGKYRGVEPPSSSMVRQAPRIEVVLVDDEDETETQASSGASTSDA